MPNIRLLEELRKLLKRYDVALLRETEQEQHYGFSPIASARHQPKMNRAPAAAYARSLAIAFVSSGYPQKEKIMIRNPIDAAVYISPELSTFITGQINDPDVEQPITLEQVRNYLADMLSNPFKEAEQLHHFDVSDSVLDELDALIDEFGPSAAAVDFSQARASEPLSRVIEAVMDDENRENPPTLGEVQAAMASGLVTHLIGEGVLEEDEDDTLMAEIESFIGRFGSESLAEDFLRYE